MNRSKKSSSEVTPAHHAALIFIVIAGAFMLGLVIKTKRFRPALSEAQSELKQLEAGITNAQKLVATNDNAGLAALQKTLSEKEALVRTFKFQSEGDGGAPFVDASNPQAVERLLAEMLTQARELDLVICSDEPKRAQELEPRFAKLVTRQIRFEGTFPQLYHFLWKMRALPHRVLVLDLTMKELKALPGMLEISLTVSV